uniref:Uncharacterized protein n=1 Tax=Arcella intermedia TaxID=1963864 RepID=A0A6B2LCH7_9EUKA
MCQAAYNGDLNTVKFLLAKMTTEQKNGRNKRKQTALYCAARQGHDKIVQLLLNEKGIDVNAQEEHGSTALHAASFGPHPKVLSLLLSFGADTSICNRVVQGNEIAQLTAFGEARGKAFEVWSAFNRGGVKGLQQAGFPVCKGRGTLTASARNRQAPIIGQKLTALAMDDVTPLAGSSSEDESTECKVTYSEFSDDEDNGIERIYTVLTEGNKRIQIVAKDSVSVYEFHKILYHHNDLREHIETVGSIDLYCKKSNGEEEKLVTSKKLRDYHLDNDNSVIVIKKAI